MSDETRVVQLTLTKNQFVAFVAATNLGVFCAMGGSDDEQKATGRKLFDGTQQALDNLGVDGWEAFLDDIQRVGIVAFPELREMSGHFVATVRKRRR